MRKLTLILSLFLFALLPAGAVKRIDANPINIAFTLSQETDPDAIASTLRYYGYEPMEGRLPSRPTESQANSSLKTQDSRQKTEYTHPNGSVIKYSFKDATEAQPYPYVEVKSNRSSKETDNALKNLNFKQKGSEYIRNIGQHARTETHCTRSHQEYLVFHRTVLPRK